jgi:hypothetical protein
MNLFDKIGGRKFVAATLTVAVGLVVMAVKGDVPPGLLHLLEVTLGVFASGNVVASFAGALYAREQSPEQTAKANMVTEASTDSPAGGVGRSPLEPTDPVPPGVSPPPPPITIEAVYGGLSEVYQKVTAVEASVGELSKSASVSQKVLNVLLEKSQ